MKNRLGFFFIQWSRELLTCLDPYKRPLDQFAGEIFDCAGIAATVKGGKVKADA